MKFIRDRCGAHKKQKLTRKFSQHRSGRRISLTRWLDGVAGKVAENTLTVLLLATTFSIIRSLQLGQDANWDLKNYHFYNAFALFHHRFDADLAPAMAQTYFNPILDLPFYGLVVAGFSPKCIAALMALPHALAIICASKITWEVLSRSDFITVAFGGCLLAL